MSEILYTVGIQVDTTALQRGATQARTSLQQIAQAEAQLERQSTQTARALSTQARETATAAARLRDQARAAREARDVQLAASLNAQARALSTQAREARASATALREQARASREASQAARQQAQAQAAPGTGTSIAQGLGGGGLLGGARAIGGALGISTGAVAGIAGAATAVALLTREAGQAATEMLNLQTRFTAATGSASTGAREFATVSSLANRLGVDVTALATAYASFTAASRGTSLEGEQSRKVFESVAAAAARMGVSSEQTSRALNALQQMISKGTVQSEELRGQLSEALPGAFQVAARAMGVTTQALGKLLEQGLLASDVFVVKLAQQLDKEAGPAVERLGVGAARLSNTLKEVATTVAGPFVTAWDAAAGSLATFLGRMFATQAAIDETNRKLAKDTERSIQAVERLTAAERERARVAALPDPRGTRETGRTAQQEIIDTGERRAIAQQTEELLFGAGGFPRTDPQKVAAETAQAFEGANKKRIAGNDAYSASLKRTLDETKRFNAELGVLRTQQGDVLASIQALTPATETNRSLLEKQVGTIEKEITTREKRLKTIREEEQAADKAIRKREQEAEAAERLADQERRTDLELRERLTAIQIGLTQGEEAQQRFTEGRQRLTQAQQDAANATLKSAEALQKDNAQLREWSRTMQQVIEQTKSSGLADIAGGRGIGVAGFARPDQVGTMVNMVPFTVQGQERVAMTDVESRQREILQLQGDIQREILTPQDFEKWVVGVQNTDSAYKALQMTLIDTRYALKTQREEAEEAAEAIQDVAHELSSTVLGALQDLTSKGAKSFKDFANSVIQDLLRILQQKFLAPQLEKWIELGIGAATSLLGGLGGGGAGAAANLGTALGGTGGLQFGQTGGPLRRGLTLVGEAGPEAIATRGGRSMVFPTSHPVTRAALRSASVPRRQYGGVLPSAVMGSTGSEAAMSTMESGQGANGQGTGNVYITVYAQDAASFQRSRGEIQRSMSNAFKAAQRS